MTLRDKATKLYENLVTSPPISTGVAAALVSAGLTAVYTDTILVIMYSVLAFLISFGLCSRPLVARLLGLILYMLPVQTLIVIAHLVLHARLLVGLTAGIPVLVILGFCSPLFALLYAVLAAIVSLLVSSLDALAAFASSIIVLVAILTLVGPDALSLARAAVLAWADDNYALIERRIRGIEEEVEWKALVLKNSNDELYLVEPGIHYGPFRGAGSSRFPHMLLEATGGRAVALHGCGSHEHNLVSSSEAKAYAKLIAASLSTAKRASCTPLRPLKLRGANGWNVAMLGCFEKPLMIAWSEKGNEDFPCEALNEAAGQVILVDAHNKEIDKVDTRGLLETIKEALGARSPCRGGVHCCWRLVKIDDGVARKAGMCADWVLTLSYACDNSRLDLIILPANNIDPMAASMYKRVLGDTLLVTIDDHSCAAMLAGEGVRPLAWEERLADTLRRALEECEPQPCTLARLEGKARVRVWGYSALREISYHLARGLKLQKLPILIYVGLALASILAGLIHFNTI